MKSNTLQAFAKAMQRFDIPIGTQNQIIDDLRKKRGLQKDLSPDEIEWVTMLAPLNVERRSMQTNMHNRPAHLRPIFEEYLLILNRVKDEIERAQTHGTLAEATRRAALVNEQRALDGKGPGPQNANYWQSWVPPHIRQAFTVRVEQAYAKAGGTGGRFVPFIPMTLRRNLAKREQALQTTLKRVHNAHCDIPGTGMGSTAYRALYLAAVRMAEISLCKLVRAYKMGMANPVDEPIPVNWLALLDAPMRRRLKDAQANPAAVTLDGLSMFYHRPPTETMALDVAEQDLEKVPFNDKYFDEFEREAAAAGDDEQG